MGLAMANIYSEKSLNVGDYYLELHTLVKNLVSSDFFEDEYHVYRGITNPDVVYAVTAVHDAFYLWIFGGSNFQFDSEGNGLAGTVTGIAIYD